MPKFHICQPDGTPRLPCRSLNFAVGFCYYYITTGLDCWVEVDGVRLPEDEWRRILLEVFDIDVS